MALTGGIMAVIAVTGDIGSGKSTITKIFADKLNCNSFNADIVAKNLWFDENIKQKALNRWGNKILDSSGKIILPEISRIIFSSLSEHNFCNELLHKSVMMELMRLTLNLDYSVVEIPLLPEAGKYDFIDSIIYVSADFDVRLNRCKIQRGWNKEELIRRESFLLPHNERISTADYVINNNGSLIDLHKKISEIIDFIL